MRHLVVLVFLSMTVSVVRSAPVRGVSQTWTYDSVSRVGSMKVINTSHKLITAFCISIQGLHADGTVDESETMYDLLPMMVGSKQAGESFESNAFQPGAVMDKVMRDAGMPDTKVTAEVTVIAFIDGTVEATDQRALQTLLNERQARILAMQKVNEVIRNGKGDYVAELHALAVSMKKPNDALGSVTAGYILLGLQELDQQGVVPSAFADMNDQRISLMTPHVKLTQEVQP